ncbi:MAG TPA: hypothetical protein VGQ59_12520 [Cyclobacteriaceae bacterium]|jgi:hypothetical protein|nr:hypothetical protein [Cyclobacteriaceae bacterium]
MKRVILLTAIAILAFFIIYLLKNPDELNQLWLYVIGLAGTAIQLGKIVINKLHDLLSKVENSKDPPKPVNKSKQIIPPVKQTVVAKS